MRWKVSKSGDRYAIVHGQVIRAFTCPCASQEKERQFAEAVVNAMNAAEPVNRLAAVDAIAAEVMNMVGGK